MTKRPSHLEKMEIKEKHAERRALIEKRENINRKEWIKEMKTRDDIRPDRIGGA